MLVPLMKERRQNREHEPFQALIALLVFSFSAEAALDVLTCHRALA
jgi:hypothetical protein